MRDRNSQRVENSELKLELLRWRKKVSIYRLKLASADEDVRLHLDNANAISLQLQSVLETNQGLEARVAAVTQELGRTEASCSTYQDRVAKLKVWAKVLQMYCCVQHK